MTDMQRSSDKVLVDWVMMAYGTTTPLDWIRANQQRLREEMRQNPFPQPPIQPLDRYSEVE